MNKQILKVGGVMCGSSIVLIISSIAQRWCGDPVLAGVMIIIGVLMFPLSLIIMFAGLVSPENEVVTKSD